MESCNVCFFVTVTQKLCMFLMKNLQSFDLIKHRKEYNHKLEYSSNGCNAAVSGIVGNLNAGAFIAGVDDGVVANVDANVTIITDDITWFCIGKAADTVSHTSLCLRGTRKIDAKMSVYTLNKTGTVSTVG